MRPLEAGDLPRLVPLVQEMERHHGDPVPSAAAIEQAFGALPAGVEILIAVAEDGAVIGLASVSRQFPGIQLSATLYLKDIFVAAAARRCGIARRLMRALAAMALARGCSRIDWRTARDNDAARAFYERLGAAPWVEAVSYRLDGPALATLAAEAQHG